ncbi:hypothetical protein LOK74_15105 [Brevibacillus humidisoli]|uniref:hypothetical protein n=1 Tax=Brevibacillus humidisoli TaxID=2895522 RepID=UPI001E4B46CA|nr:hypothetical protein [Brevibacillus humidisoli]UFJ39394.1 hypothetical protein LOK74_15105 [Brevibacillus humidisoli]
MKCRITIHRTTIRHIAVWSNIGVDRQDAVVRISAISVRRDAAVLEGADRTDSKQAMPTHCLVGHGFSLQD